MPKRQEFLWYLFVSAVVLLGEWWIALREGHSLFVWFGP
jgi:hypothetical protein